MTHLTKLIPYYILLVLFFTSIAASASGSGTGSLKQQELFLEALFSRNKNNIAPFVSHSLDGFFFTDGNTPLHVFATAPLVEPGVSQPEAPVEDSRMIVRSLVAAEANPNARNALNLTPLMVVAISGRDDPSYLAIMDELITAGADVNAQDENGDTALHFAARAGRTNIVRAFLDRPDTLTTLANNAGETARDLIRNAGVISTNVNRP